MDFGREVKRGEGLMDGWDVCMIEMEVSCEMYVCMHEKSNLL